MMKSLKFTIILMATVVLVSCHKKEGPNKPIIEQSGITDYFIMNESDLDLKVNYKIAPNSILPDSTVTLPAQSRTRIYRAFRYGGMGDPYPPSYIFYHLKFYKKSDDDLKNPFLTIEPIVDENWNNTDKKGNTIWSFELIITSKDLE